MSKIVYLDNAATTALDPLVLAEMLPYMSEHFGNPSSVYSIGRTTRSAVEAARKKVADILGVKPNTIFFTSGGTESNNTAIATSVNDLGCTHVITSPIEHHAVLHTVKHHCQAKDISYSFVALLPSGEVNYTDLQLQLEAKQAEGKKCLVSLMHANNEIGSLLDLKLTGDLCKTYGAIFHSDCVQTVGHYPINLSEYGVHFISAAGHKFHGPKGTGILYVNGAVKAHPLIHGGSQERNMRAGTENVYGIAGFAKALEIATQHHHEESRYISSLNAYMREQLTLLVSGVSFNNPSNSLYTILSVCFPGKLNADFILFNLDSAGICASGGSACSSGEDAGSHVIQALNRSKNGATIRFSFSKHNTTEDIDRAIAVIASLFPKEELTIA